MFTNNLGFPRIGVNRELKRLVESYWAGKTSQAKLIETASALRILHWTGQKESGLDLIPSNDFSFYDQVLDTTMLTGAIPERYLPLYDEEVDKVKSYPVNTYFAMARGIQGEGRDIPAMEMTKWFNTNYHYIVPEFYKGQTFKCSSSKIFDEFEEARSVGVLTKPVLLGPVSFLLLGKEKGGSEDFHRLDLLESLLPVYVEILQKLDRMGVQWVQVDEPFLAMDLDERAKKAYKTAYNRLSGGNRDSGLMLTTYFGGLRDNLSLACGLPVDGLHLDLVEDPGQLIKVMELLDGSMWLSLGLINGRNIWKTDLEKMAKTLRLAKNKPGGEKLMLAPSCSLLHCPVDLDQEKDEESLPAEVKRWMAFAKQKLEELSLLKKMVEGQLNEEDRQLIRRHQENILSRENSELVHNPEVKERINKLDDSALHRNSPYQERGEKQRAKLNLPDLFPTTTIGSFPQTTDVRKWRAGYRKGDISQEAYEEYIQNQTSDVIERQVNAGLDLLVHGEFERNDMVEYFGEHLAGFAFTRNGWVQSYGSRCVKPPVIYGDVSRPDAITVRWSSYAQSLTDRPVKGMLTGPVTILQWSFPRDDQPRSETARQIALAIRDEVLDLEKAGINAIQIDEPAFREGLPLRMNDRGSYLNWAVDAFRIASTVVEDHTQIHTHMCYAEFNDIIEHITRLDADVISMETSRSQMELLEAFREYDYPNQIGPGVYDIHSPRIPSKEEIASLLGKAIEVLKPEQIWVNPDCGLKTRGWEETELSLRNMVAAAGEMRKKGDLYHES